MKRSCLLTNLIPPRSKPLLISRSARSLKVAHQRLKLLRRASQVLKDVKEVIHLRRRLILQKVILSQTATVKMTRKERRRLQLREHHNLSLKPSLQLSQVVQLKVRKRKLKSQMKSKKALSLMLQIKNSSVCSEMVLQRRQHFQLLKNILRQRTCLIKETRLSCSNS